MAWTSTTSTNGKYVTLTTSSPIKMTNTTAISSDTITVDIGQKKILVGINITTAGANTAPDCDVYASTDGTNWVQVAAGVVNIDNDATGVTLALADLTNIYAPYYKLVYNDEGAAVGTSGEIKFIVSYTQ